jgi:hypothetical protein
MLAFIFMYETMYKYSKYSDIGPWSIPFIGGDYIGRMSPPVAEVVRFGCISMQRLNATCHRACWKAEKGNARIMYRRKSFLIYLSALYPYQIYFIYVFNSVQKVTKNTVIFLLQVSSCQNRREITRE